MRDMDIFEHVLDYIIDVTMHIIEYIGVIVLAVAVIRGLIEYIRRKPEAVRTMGRGMAVSLSFLLGGEILRTVTITTFREIGIVAGIIALRTALTLLIHWEGKHLRRPGEHPQTDHVTVHDELRAAAKQQWK